MTARTDVLAVDVGFEFVDLVLERDGVIATAKHPVDAAPPDRAVIDAVDRFSADAGFDIGDLGAVRVTSTGGINALFTRRGARVALVTNEGFGDTLHLGRQNRRDLYDPVARPATPSFLVRHADIHEVGGRLDAEGREVTPLDMDGLSRIADAIAADPVDAIAICLLHAHVEPAHERRGAALVAERLPGVPVVVSHVADPNPREFERTVSTCLEAWLRPSQAAAMRNLEDALSARGFGGRLQFASGSGQLLSVETASANVSAHLTSGPASAARHAADLARASGIATAIAIDIGSTTTDMALIRDGRPATTRAAHVAEVPQRQVVDDVHSHALGGLARALPDGLGGIVLGARDDAALPTLSECLAFLGQIPIGIGGDIAERLERLAAETSSETGEEAARAVVAAARHSVAQAVLRYCVRRNVDPARATLVAMGGLGPAMVPGIAEALGGTHVLVPDAAAVAGAMGLLSMGSSRTVRIRVDAGLAELGSEGLAECFQRLRSQFRPDIAEVERLDVEVAPAASMHPVGIRPNAGDLTPDTIAAAFAGQYMARYGIVPPFPSLHVFAMTLTRGEEEPERSWPIPADTPAPTVRGWHCEAVQGGLMMTRRRG